MAKNRAPWETAARAGIIGKRTELKSLAGYWITPKKYSVPAENAINAASLQESKKLPPSIIRKLAPVFEKKKLMSEAAMMEILTDDEMDKVLESQGGKNTVATVNVISLALLYGIGSHNLTGDQDTGTDIVDQELVDNILQYEPLTTEMYGIITRHNRPLSQKPSSKSKTQPSGSTTG